MCKRSSKLVSVQIMTHYPGIIYTAWMINPKIDTPCAYTYIIYIQYTMGLGRELYAHKRIIFRFDEAHTHCFNDEQSILNHFLTFNSLLSSNNFKTLASFKRLKMDSATG